MSETGQATVEASPPGRFPALSRLSPKAWLVRHLHAAIFTLGQLARSPVNALTTSTIIGIALALPTGLYVLLDNVNALSGRWEGGAQISLYLTDATSDDEARRLAAMLADRPEIERVELITRAEALAEYHRLIGFSDPRDVFDDENPLPASLIVFPRAEHSDTVAVRGIIEVLSELAEVDTIQSDLEWIERLHAMVAIVQRGVLILAGLFGIGVVLITGNTIRLGIQSRHEEIEVAKLVGATDAFIRRPFLYSGMWYGLLGGLIACALINVSLEILEPAVERLARLYQSDFRLAGTGFAAVVVLLSGGTALGVLGSWNAVARHLHAIEPS